MRPLPLLLGLTTAATLAMAGPVPAASAASPVHLHAALHHSSVFPNATGHSDYHRDGTARSIEVTVHHIAKLSGKRVQVFANHHIVGTIRVNTIGSAHREWDTEHGQTVPFVAAGGPIRVRTMTGTTIAPGVYRRVHHG
jgi:hypothetical protein